MGQDGDTISDAKDEDVRTPIGINGNVANSEDGSLIKKEASTPGE